MQLFTNQTADGFIAKVCHDDGTPLERYTTCGDTLAQALLNLLGKLPSPINQLSFETDIAQKIRKVLPALGVTPPQKKNPYETAN